MGAGFGCQEIELGKRTYFNVKKTIYITLSDGSSNTFHVFFDHPVQVEVIFCSYLVGRIFYFIA